MPTPFTHLKVAQALLADDAVPVAARAGLDAERGAFLLGSIAADARVSSGLRREDTHFYAYGQPIAEPPWRVMMRMYPVLARPSNAAQRAFLAAYVAHLSMDELWTREITDPYFANGDWASLHERFVMLHALLVCMDERDYPHLCDWQRETLLAARPATSTSLDSSGGDGWLPFMTADDLTAWRDLIGRQLPPGQSETLAILSGRISMATAKLQAIVDSQERMERDLWIHVPRSLVADVETRMVAYARAQMLAYLDEYGR